MGLVARRTFGRMSAARMRSAARTAASARLRPCSRVVWLETMSTNGPDPAAAATPAPPPGQTPAQPVGAFSITGYTYSHDGVARLLARLSVIPHLENVKLGSSVVENGGKRPIVKFAINAGLRKAQVTS